MNDTEGTGNAPESRPLVDPVLETAGSIGRHGGGGLDILVTPESPTIAHAFWLSARDAKGQISTQRCRYRWLIMLGEDTIARTITTDDPTLRVGPNEWPVGEWRIDVEAIRADDRGNLLKPDTPLASGSITIDLADAIDRTRVTLDGHAVGATSDQVLWTVIRSSTKSISFDEYGPFIDSVFGGKNSQSDTAISDLHEKLKRPFPGVDNYKLLKVATEVFLTTTCEVDTTRRPSELFDAIKLTDEASRYNRESIQQSELEKMWSEYLATVPNANDVKTLPYFALIAQKLGEAPRYTNREIEDQYSRLLEEKLTRPFFLELIWSYWQEEGMLVQTMNAISFRFQNRRVGSGRDPLAEFELDPLRPLNNILWGYIQDDQHRLGIMRRAYEYDHQYGIVLRGKAVPELRPADSRSKFLEAFHTLLQLTSIFFKEDADTTVRADAFPVLNALKEVHMILTQGSHNQYGDLAWTARQEMLMQQWILARPEMREFLPTRVMAAYPEPWMDRVEAMKRIQGWNDTPVIHFGNLATFGEQLLLTVRFGNWSKAMEEERAANWARYWRSEIQGYIHAYRAVTGVDISADTINTQRADERFLSPAYHIERRMARNPQKTPAVTTNGVEKK